MPERTACTGCHREVRRVAHRDPRAPASRSRTGTGRGSGATRSTSRPSACRSGLRPSSRGLALSVGDVPLRLSLPVQYRYEGNIFSGEKRMELKVVPALSVRSTPDIVIVPTGLRPAAHDNATAAATRAIRRGSRTMHQTSASVASGALFVTATRISRVLAAASRSSCAAGRRRSGRSDVGRRAHRQRGHDLQLHALFAAEDVALVRYWTGKRGAAAHHRH